MNQQADQLNIKLNYQSSDFLGDTMVAVDFNRFSQVLRNIISNALKFTTSGGVIDVRVADSTTVPATASLSSESQFAPPKDSEFIRIDIADTGSGMTKAQQESLFKGAVQFADTSATNCNGAGLGLWSKPSPFHHILLFSCRQSRSPSLICMAACYL
jgi:two-component system, sensor histidine kinase and response regulator